MPGLFVPSRPSVPRAFFALAAALAPAFGLVPTTGAASRPAVRAPSAMAVTPDDQATRVAVGVMRDGGNAVDAAVATAFALAVTAPYAGNLGGGGFLLYRGADGDVAALDFREVAPRKLRAEMFLDEDGRPVPGRSLRSGLAVGVPGSVAGLAEAHRRWGSKPWSDLLAPAIRLADKGSVVSPKLARVFERSGPPLLEHPAARAVFAPQGRLPLEGERLLQPELAATLRRIAAQGSDGFYRGETARMLERAIVDAGGVLDREDLAAYAPVLRKPVEGVYRGHRVISFPPPSSGGIVLLQMLGMLERFDLRASGCGSSLTAHLMTEVERRAYADRSRWLGDPAYYNVPVERLLDASYLDERLASVALDRATPSPEIASGDAVPPESPDTLHFSVADATGAVAALTTTLNTTFGSALVARGSGVLLNSEIDDFAVAPGVPNRWGLSGGEANAIEGGKRPLSSMTPTIVLAPSGGPRPLLVLGSPGGGKIITTVLQVLVNVIDHGMPLQEAVDFPRFHHQWMPDVIAHESRAFPEDVIRALRGRGHRVEPAPGPLGNANVIGLDKDGNWLGAADPRREGSARGF